MSRGFAVLFFALANMAKAAPFVTPGFVPVTTFFATTTPDATATVPMRQDLRSYIVDRNDGLFVAHCPVLGDSLGEGAAECASDVQVVPLRPDDWQGAELVLSDLPVGWHTIVTNALPMQNQFPIVTHWDQSLNDGRGGQQAGAKDALGRVFLDGAGKFKTESAAMNPDKTSPWTFAWQRFALFGVDSAVERGRVPSYERYLGENFSIFSVSTGLAHYLSNQVVEVSGYPLIHRNGSELPFSESAVSGLPAYQVIHAAIVQPDRHPDKSSLVSIVLPPYWTPNPHRPYPVLFYGAYDVHEPFSKYAVGAVKMMDSLRSSVQGDVVTVMWNGGGAFGPIAIQRSAYDNMARIFERLESEIGASASDIVTVGCSRGGGTSLAVASNPYHSSYSVKYVLAYSPSAYAVGERVTSFGNLTYPGMLSVYANFLGYRYSWEEQWTSPGPKRLTAGELFLRNFLDTTDPNVADRDHSHGSDVHLRSLRAKGTKIVLTVGTNDSFSSVLQAPQFVSKALAENIPVQFNIAHRFGHCGTNSLLEAPENYLRKIFAQDESFTRATIHHRRRSEEEFKVPEVFVPESPMLNVEMPKWIVQGDPFTAVVAGSVGTRYRLTIFRIDADIFAQSKQIVPVGGAIFERIGRLAADPLGSPMHNLGATRLVETLPATNEEGLYAYTLDLAGAGTSEVDWTPVALTPATAEANRYPIIKLLAQRPRGDFADFLPELAADNRSNGLSSF